MVSHKQLILFFVFISMIRVGITNASATERLQLHQVLQDDVNGVDGLGNPRNVKVLADNSTVFVSSGDDNAFAVFSADRDFKLSFSQVFKNAAADIHGLEGASGVTYLGNGQKVIVTGYYDGAVSLFSTNDNRYRYDTTISDELGYNRVFDRYVPLAKVDHFGLLGAWDIIKTDDEKQLFVAGYMSNAISILDVDADKNVIFNRTVTTATPLQADLGKPITLALSPLNDELYVLGFDNNQLTIFDRSDKGALIPKQIIKDQVDGVTAFLNPQKMIVSPDGHVLYVACAGSNTLMAFKKSNDGKFVWLQSIDNSDVGGAGLEGASSLAISADGSTLYAAGESGNGVFIFSVGSDGQLSFEGKRLTANGHELKKIASLTLTDDNQYLLVATGKSNSLVIFKTLRQ
ncbi:hypothetical protein HR45_16700 [Shewanella mangrovi]|uniref:Uncharacterized protein n=1 Tax=Shewanella mangrovi TaxID=1515746 RepID=A0A094JEJ2_9GAMM|nr:beta-propeller fold lactonase family protein [Shewanella mangrovi]KFZ36454.1 hypothetical protein HR45_16700 [Shewanella mangrovi]